MELSQDEKDKYEVELKEKITNPDSYSDVPRKKSFSWADDHGSTTIYDFERYFQVLNHDPNKRGTVSEALIEFEELVKLPESFDESIKYMQDLLKEYKEGEQ